MGLSPNSFPFKTERGADREQSRDGNEFHAAMSHLSPGGLSSQGGRIIAPWMTLLSQTI